MNLQLALILLQTCVLVVCAGALYNRLLRARHDVREAWARIDALVRERDEELAKLVEVCRQHMPYEREALERLIRAGSNVVAAAGEASALMLGRTEQSLRGELRRLLSVAERFPALRADGTYAHLQSRISGLGMAMGERRELYNNAVRSHNATIEEFPAVLFARLAGLQRADLLLFGAAEMADVPQPAKVTTLRRPAPRASHG